MPASRGSGQKVRRRRLQPISDSDTEAGFATDVVPNYPAIICHERKSVAFEALVATKRLSGSFGIQRRSSDEFEAANP